MKNHEILISLLLFISCSSALQPRTHEAIAIVYNTEGQNLGKVTFKTEGTRTLITTELNHLSPNSYHGFHIHEYGNCKGNFTTAGNHFNPTNQAHGKLSRYSHAGDLGNLRADSNGEVRSVIASEHISFTKEATSIIGKSIIVHSDRDDLLSPPAGKSGNRLGCGVIKSI